MLTSVVACRASYLYDHIKINAKLSLCLIWNHATKACGEGEEGGGDLDSHSLNPGTKHRCMVSFTPGHLSP
jgi:hypothetical protein